MRWIYVDWEVIFGRWKKIELCVFGLIDQLNVIYNIFQNAWRKVVWQTDIQNSESEYVKKLKSQKEILHGWLATKVYIDI